MSQMSLEGLAKANNLIGLKVLSLFSGYAL